jgi:hypothetical protein
MNYLRRFVLVTIGLFLAWGAESAWAAAARASSSTFESQPGLLALAMAFQVAGGLALGLAIRRQGLTKWPQYMWSVALIIAVLPLVLIGALFAFQLRLVPSSGPLAASLGEVVTLASRLRPILGLVVGLGLAAGVKPRPVPDGEVRSTTWD